MHAQHGAMSKAWHKRQVPMVSLVAVAVVAVASRRPAPQRRGKPKHVQTELQRCGMANMQLLQHGRRPQMLQPPLQEKEVELEDEAAAEAFWMSLAKDSEDVERDDGFQSALAKELGLD